MSKPIIVDAELSDLHPKVKHQPEGGVHRTIEIKLKTTQYNTELLKGLSELHGEMCTLSIRELQPHLGLGKEQS